MNKKLKIAAITSAEAYEILKKHITSKAPNFPESYNTAPERYFYGNTQHREYLSRWLENVIVSIINHSGGVASKVNTVGAKIKAKSGKEIYVKHRAAKKGEPDVRAIIRGQAIYYEVKIGSDRLSVDQNNYITELIHAGAKVYIIKTVDDFLNSEPIKSILDEKFR